MMIQLDHKKDLKLKEVVIKDKIKILMGNQQLEVG